MKYLLSFLLSFSIFGLYAQDTLNYRSELFFQFDNDLLLFDAGDRYYTNGLFLGYRQQNRSDGKWHNPFGINSIWKSTWELTLCSQIYNPYDLKTDVPEEIDRPYAGLLYFNSRYRSYWSKTVWTLGADLGWLGPGTGAGDIQTNLHSSFGWVTPRGWGDFEINDTPVLQVSSSIMREVIALPFFSVAGELGVNFGSVHNYIDASGLIRLGRCLPVEMSVLSNGSVGKRATSRREWIEFFLVYKPEIKRVFYNATIDGNWIGEPSDFVRESEPWLYQQGFGFMLSGSEVDFSALWYFLGEEVVGGRKHRYGTLTLIRRF